MGKIDMNKGNAIILMVLGKKVRNRNSALPYYMYMDQNWNVWDSYGKSIEMNSQSTHGWREVFNHQLLECQDSHKNRLPEQT